jgi:hypothetical protein
MRTDVAAASSHIANHIKLAIVVPGFSYVVMVMATPDDIKNILGPNEKVELYVKEKIYHHQINIDSLIITDQRIIPRHPHALGLKKDYTDYSYSGIAGVLLDKGIMRSTIKLTLKRDAKPHELGKLPTSLAEKGYGIIRENVGRFQAPFSTG